MKKWKPHSWKRIEQEPNHEPWNLSGKLRFVFLDNQCLLSLPKQLIHLWFSSYASWVAQRYIQMHVMAATSSLVANRTVHANEQMVSFSNLMIGKKRSVTTTVSIRFFGSFNSCNAAINRPVGTSCSTRAIVMIGPNLKIRKHSRPRNFIHCWSVINR